MNLTILWQENRHDQQTYVHSAVGAEESSSTVDVDAAASLDGIYGDYRKRLWRSLCCKYEFYGHSEKVPRGRTGLGLHAKLRIQLGPSTLSNKLACEGLKPPRSSVLLGPSVDVQLRIFGFRVFVCHITTASVSLSVHMSTTCLQNENDPCIIPNKKAMPPRSPHIKPKCPWGCTVF